MKKYIAFYNSANSGVQTYDKAVEWASVQMGQKHQIEWINICEVVSVIERVQPAVRVVPFRPDLEEAKAA